MTCGDIQYSLVVWVDLQGDGYQMYRLVYTDHLPLVFAVAELTVMPSTVTGGIYSRAPLAKLKADSSSSPVCCNSALHQACVQ